MHAVRQEEQQPNWQWWTGTPHSLPSGLRSVPFRSRFHRPPPCNCANDGTEQKWVRPAISSIPSKKRPGKSNSRQQQAVLHPPAGKHPRNPDIEQHARDNRDQCRQQRRHANVCQFPVGPAISGRERCLYRGRYNKQVPRYPWRGRPWLQTRFRGARIWRH